MPLNIATILIASTVLGATENDQIHFFSGLSQRCEFEGGKSMKELAKTRI